MNNRWLAPAPAGSTARHDAAQALRDRSSLVARCARRWPLWLALLALAGLLLAFQRVVHEGVRQGDLRRLAVAAHADAMWRCNVISGRAPREDCHALLNTGHAGHAQQLPSPPSPRSQR